MSSLDPVVIDINTSDSKSTINLNTKNIENSNSKPSVNFGGGIELLMNEKKRGSSAEIGLGELSELENELNDLSTDISKKTLENSRSNLFNNAINMATSDQKVSFKEPDNIEKNKTINVESDTPNLGEQTSQNYSTNKSWDGYGKFSNVPVTTHEPPLSKEELVREKFKYLRRLEDLERKGANLTKKYSMDDPLAELQGEYEMIVA